MKNSLTNIFYCTTTPFKLRLFNKFKSKVLTDEPLSLIFFVVILLLSSCVNEAIPDNPNEPNPGPSVSGEMVTLDLPGYIGIDIANVSSSSSRTDDTMPPSDNNSSFNDGDSNEYGLASGDDHHFLIVYKGSATDNLTDLPLAVLPLLITDEDIEPGAGNDVKDHNSDKITSYDNVTLVAHSLVSANNALLTGNININTKEGIKTLFDGNMIVALINFDQSIIDYTSLTTSFPDKSTTKGVLARIAKEKLLHDLCVNNFTITTPETTDKSSMFFVMSNSVSINNSGSIDYNYITGNLEDGIYSDIVEAKKHPAISVYVERLATKFTVKFKPVINPSNEEGETLEIKSIDEKGFPVYSVSINKYVAYEFGANGYEIKSTPVNATIKIVGYGVSNLERNERLLKNIENYNYYNNWNDHSSSRNNHRSYWSIDPHYILETNSNGDFTNAFGYPHQFRLALETDTVASLFSNDNGNGYTYKHPGNRYDEVTVTVNGINRTIHYYKEIGTLNNSNLNSQCVLKYKSFDDIKSLFEKNISIDKETGDGSPFYCSENTYYDPGMTTGVAKGSSSWIWEWRRAPYSTSTNLILLCQITPEELSGDFDAVYRGQNNIFYYNLYDVNSGDNTGVITSKLGILNNVMLNGGNAGFQIFDGKWDSHERGTQITILDRIAWNENGYLWLGTTADDGTVTYERMQDYHFDLIPAELSGGDGQALIAPKEEFMGGKYKYYIAPYQTGENSSEMDMTKAVEISFNHLVGLIHKIIGPIDVFKNGYMYYSIPISHSEASFIESDETPSNESWRTLGKVGVVRNNWYEITVEGIQNIGTPVHVTDQPIVPVMDNRRSYINMGVKLMNWHTIKQENVPM